MLGLGLLLLTSKSRAEPTDDVTRNSARDLGYAGVEAYQAGNYRKAKDDLGRAFELLKAPTLGLWSARSLEKLGDWASAVRRYREVLALPATSEGKAEVQEQARRDAEKELSALSPKLAHVRFALARGESGHVSAWLDDAPLPSDFLGNEVELNPGPHRVRAVSSQRERTYRFDVKSGEVRTLELGFDSEQRSHHVDTKSPTNVRRTVGWVAIGTGGASLLFGAVTGVMLLNKKSDLDSSDACDSRGCLASERDNVDSYNSLRTLSSIGFIAGLALEAAGATLVLLPDRSRPKAQTGITLKLNPAGATLGGRF